MIAWPNLQCELTFRRPIFPRRLPFCASGLALGPLILNAKTSTQEHAKVAGCLHRASGFAADMRHKRDNLLHTTGKVEGGGSRVEGRGSRVEGWELRVEGGGFAA